MQLGLAALGTLFVAGLSSGLISLLNNALPARFGGFCVALGWVLSRYSYTGKWDRDLALGLASITGGALGLLVFWMLLLR
ncbi:hypothetical protein, partial [Escherichia coli]|uniref:hypothetical protein n=1 Tax=Escherichia coli TaxID=562 RepID=UPI0013D3946C